MTLNGVHLALVVGTVTMYFYWPHLRRKLETYATYRRGYRYALQAFMNKRHTPMSLSVLIGDHPNPFDQGARDCIHHMTSRNLIHDDRKAK